MAEAPTPAGADGVVWALLMAAGESSRMRTPKPLLPWLGQPLVTFQIEQLQLAGARVLVVVGHEAARVGSLASAAGALVVENPAYREGRAGSIRAGALALPDDARAIVALNVDQPRPAALIRHVLNRHLAGDDLITTPEQGGRRGHPVIFAGALLDELRAVAEASEGLRAILRRHADERRIVSVDDPAIHLEFNTPAEYEAALLSAGED